MLFLFFFFFFPFIYQASPHWLTLESMPKSTMARSGRTAQGVLGAQPLVVYLSATCVVSTARHQPNSRVTWAPTTTTRLHKAQLPPAWLPAALSLLAAWWRHTLSMSLATQWWTCWSQTALVLQYHSHKVSSREHSNNILSPLAENKVGEGWIYS